MSYQTIRFREVKRRAAKNLPCPGCGKRVKRQTTFMQTINPFNKNADGQPKTAAEIQAELAVEAAEWVAKPEWCASCRVESGAGA